jgi:hypothetical protein
MTYYKFFKYKLLPYEYLTSKDLGITYTLSTITVEPSYTYSPVISIGNLNNWYINIKLSSTTITKNNLIFKLKGFGSAGDKILYLIYNFLAKTISLKNDLGNILYTSYVSSNYIDLRIKILNNILSVDYLFNNYYYTTIFIFSILSNSTYRYYSGNTVEMSVGIQSTSSGSNIINYSDVYIN